MYSHAEPMPRQIPQLSQSTFVYASRPPSPPHIYPPLQPTYPSDLGDSSHAPPPQHAYEAQPYSGVIQPKNNNAEDQTRYSQGQVGMQEAPPAYPPMYSQGPVGMTCGQNFAIFSALLLMGSGIVLVVIGPMHYDAPGVSAFLVEFRVFVLYNWYGVNVQNDVCVCECVLQKSFDTICTTIKRVDGCSGGTMFGANSVYRQNFGGEVLHACTLSRDIG